ncbi:odorant receptor 22c-like [Atheta coriaria]|uniref:odorant receptor 22c-like n=1 Tax=Dalotia coriaria TaxID=877792 RepID=UPI0031F339B1
MLSFDATIVCGSDSFFIGACLNIHAQFVILHNRLKNLGTKKTDRNFDLNNEVVRCVKQHNFLLHYTNVLIHMYSIGLIFQFFVTTYSLCIEIFIFTKRDTVGMIIGVIYCCMLTSQLALYCFPADAVNDISEQCAEAIYSCPWYDNSPELKHVVMNCMQRSHKRLIFTAGGLIDIDKRAFTKIFKGILSLNTLMKNVFE